MLPLCIQGRDFMLHWPDGLKYSDHCLLLVDFGEGKLFSNRGSDPTARKSRGLRTKIKQQVANYITSLKSKVVAHNIFQRVIDLCKLADKPTSSPTLLKAMADSIDFQITCATLKAEKDTSHKCYVYPWSRDLAEAGRNVTFWRNCLRSYKSKGSDHYSALIPNQITQHAPH